MAVTGTVMAAFVAVHMVGNLKAFMGPEAYNSYAAWLRSVLYPLLPHEGLLWIMRAVLAACLVLHIAAGVDLWRRGRVARVVVLPVETGGVEGVAVRLNEKRRVAACSKRLGVGREAGDEVLWVSCQHQVHLSDTGDGHCRRWPVSGLFQLVTGDRLQERTSIGMRARHKLTGAAVPRTL